MRVNTSRNRNRYNYWENWSITAVWYRTWKPAWSLVTGCYNTLLVYCRLGVERLATKRSPEIDWQ